MKLLWLTDLHFDRTELSVVRRLETCILEKCPDVLLITGDISDGYRFVKDLKLLGMVTKRKIYFILGNHDYYHSSIEDTRRQARLLSEENEGFHYLTTCGVHELTEKTAIIGHDSWADGRFGDYYHSHVILRDFFAIADFIGKEGKQRLALMQALADEAADYFSEFLPVVFEMYDRVILLTHVPPCAEACRYKNGAAGVDWGPFFVSQGVGEALKRIMREHPEKELLVLFRE